MLPSELAENGEIELKEGNGKLCCECGEPVTEYLWSPLFCPECDKERMDRIDKGMKEIEEKMEQNRTIV